MSEFKVSLGWANVAISRSAVFAMEKLHSFTCPWYSGKYQGTYVGNAMKKSLPNIIYLRVVRRKRTPRCTLSGKITNPERYHEIMHDHKNYSNGWLLKIIAFLPGDRLEKFPDLVSKMS